jgi:hypothetical protein
MHLFLSSKCLVVLKKSKNWFLPVTTVLKNKRTGQRTTYPELPTCLSVLSRKPSGSLQVFINLELEVL